MVLWNLSEKEEFWKARRMGSGAGTAGENVKQKNRRWGGINEKIVGV